jgi:hypothetical protein
MTDQDKEMLRDVFAGLAMCGWIINGDFDKESIPQLAYAMADEMMESRKPKQEVGIKTVKKARNYAKNNANS